MRKMIKTALTIGVTDQANSYLTELLLEKGYGLPGFISKMRLIVTNPTETYIDTLPKL